MAEVCLSLLPNPSSDGRMESSFLFHFHFRAPLTITELSLLGSHQRRRWCDEMFFSRKVLHFFVCLLFLLSVEWYKEGTDGNTNGKDNGSTVSKRSRWKRRRLVSVGGRLSMWKRDVRIYSRIYHQ